MAGVPPVLQAASLKPDAMRAVPLYTADDAFRLYCRRPH